MNGKPAGVTEVDFYWSGLIDINTEKTIILVQDRMIPKGVFKKLSPSEVGLKESAKFQIYATSETPHAISATAIKRMGYTPIEGGSFTWGSNLDMFNNQNMAREITSLALERKNHFKKFVRRNGFKEMTHSNLIWFICQS